MTTSETVRVLEIMTIAYPKYYANADAETAQKTVSLWAVMLNDVSLELVTLALRKLIATSVFPPTIAELRKAISEVENGYIITEGEAWGEVTSAIRKFGYAREIDALESMTDITAQIVKYMGWTNICLSENIMAERAHFLKVYPTIAKRKAEQSQLPDMLKIAIEAKTETNKALEIAKKENIRKERLERLSTNAKETEDLCIEMRNQNLTSENPSTIEDIREIMNRISNYN